ncbi:hypothetical protein E2C01_038528 [Portunus trituberculatus]|uniref:Pacifastin domain-containing protein n=1 Tax=Portunus trituberculatus TaxID=210409 RepID=A0A5B7FH21_PORTR|nr:hypothetical protein [Portunus trituberculatus]
MPASPVWREDLPPAVLHAAKENEGPWSGGCAGAGSGCGSPPARDGETWFDGCNTCFCSNGEAACTLKACYPYDDDRLTRPYHRRG